MIEGLIYLVLVFAANYYIILVLSSDKTYLALCDPVDTFDIIVSPSQ